MNAYVGLQLLLGTMLLLLLLQYVPLAPLKDVLIHVQVEDPIN